MVLLIEAGDDPGETEFYSIYDRYEPAFRRTDLDHGYLTTPQSQLNNRELHYLRGKAMGGTSNLNFMGKVKSEVEEAAKSFFLSAQTGLPGNNFKSIRLWIS